MRILDFLKNKFSSSTSNELIKTIHPDDEMYLFLAGHPDSRANPEKAYFDSGAGMIQKLLDILIDMKIDIKSIKSFLEFACGYGRFTRFLIQEIDKKKITVSDIYKEAVNFQKKTFKVKGFYSTHKPDDLFVNEKFDIIFVASLFSHLSENTWGDWLKKLYNLLNDNGILIFSTHGMKCMSDQKLMTKKGFTYMKMSESKTLPLNEYGTAYVTKEYVDKVSKEISGKKPNKYYEQYLWNYQDVYVIRKTS